MSIEHAILGLLSWRPMSGYDLKKIFEEASILYWSGNNNEIYRTLVKLHADKPGHARGSTPGKPARPQGLYHYRAGPGRPQKVGAWQPPSRPSSGTPS